MVGFAYIPLVCLNGINVVRYVTHGPHGRFQFFVPTGKVRSVGESPTKSPQT